MARRISKREQQVKPITDVLREYRRGELVQQASAELAAVVQAVKTLRKGGSVTITLAVSPDKHSTREVEVQAKVTSSIPKRGMKAATFFIGDGNELLRNDPDQIDAFAEEVDEDGVVTERPRLSAVPSPRDGTDG